MQSDQSSFPAGLKVGDFIQTTSHFGDIYCEVLDLIAPTESSSYWHVSYATYEKYGSKCRAQWVNSAGRIRRVISAEMAVPTIMARRERFQARMGQYDPFYGFAPAGTPLRKRDPSPCY